MLRPLMLLLMFSVCIPAICAQEDDNARGIFIRTRKNSARQKPAERPVANATAPPVRKRKRLPHVPAGSASNVPARPSQQRFVGLGYTLYLKNDEGRFVSVSPNRIFHTGQAVRLMVESNIDGYLYVLHQENNGSPKMMFPCSLAWRGDNRIWAHKPLFISPITEIKFTGDPATETLTLIVSRSPLPSLPLGGQLPAGRCNTPVSESAFNSILTRPCQCGRHERAAGERLLMRHDPYARDMEMGASDPEPDHIIVNQNSVDDILITRISLTHR